MHRHNLSDKKAAKILAEHYMKLKAQKPNAALLSYDPDEHGVTGVHVIVVDHPVMLQSIYRMTEEIECPVLQ